MGSLDKKQNYKKIAKEVIQLEINALKKLKNSIAGSFSKAVDVISKCQSKVILCGVGKSGLIAAKISATLSSVGTPSFSLSANDCSHGDLGSISKKDVLVLIDHLTPSIIFPHISTVTIFISMPTVTIFICK